MIKVKTNLANLPQFDDTFFELKCLNHFHRNGFPFQYEPDVYEEGKEKKSDFRLTKDDIELFCECKQVRIGQNIAELQFTNQCAYVRGKFPSDLWRRLFDAKLRLEVNFKINPSRTDLDELARRDWQPYDEKPEAYRVIYVQSLVRTRQWFKAGETFVWEDGGSNGHAAYNAPKTLRKITEIG